MLLPPLLVIYYCRRCGVSKFLVPTLPSLMTSSRCQRRSATLDLGGSCRVRVPEPWFTFRTGTPFFNSAWKQPFLDSTLSLYECTLGGSHQLCITESSERQKPYGQKYWDTEKKKKAACFILDNGPKVLLHDYSSEICAAALI